MGEQCPACGTRGSYNSTGRFVTEEWMRMQDLREALAKSASREAVLVEAIDCCYRMLISEADTRRALFKAENILRDAIAKIKEAS